MKTIAEQRRTGRIERIYDRQQHSTSQKQRNADGIETWIDTLFRVPSIATTTPRKLTSEGGEEIEETPSDDDVVIDRY